MRHGSIGDDGDGVVGFTSGLHQLGSDFAQILDAHVHDDDRGRGGNGGPVDIGGGFASCIVAGQENDRVVGITMGGWYAARGLYRAEELGGLPCAKFCEAVRAESIAMWTWPGANGALHLHAAFHTADIFRMGQPTMISFGQRDVRQGPGTLPVSEKIGEIAFGVPWFKHFRPAVIDEYVAAFKKVAQNAAELRG